MLYVLNLGNDHISFLFLSLFSPICSSFFSLVLKFSSYDSLSPGNLFNWAYTVAVCQSITPPPLDRIWGGGGLLLIPFHSQVIILFPLSFSGIFSLLEGSFSIYLSPLEPSWHPSLLIFPCIILLLVWIISWCQLQKWAKLKLKFKFN